ncbi:protein aurora borealis [Belonocnema kinseyi]|uniref:protein aurora borealis n=1 Tax=Belonocnema kinseyi TaxID=2817044 RepID=UPI00143D0322|nr:protein aurora borealis [Belonocnema kinseyi]
MDLRDSPTMEKMQWVTPNKNEMIFDNASLKSPISFTTPVKQVGMRPRQMTYQNNSGCFAVLPSHITPPSGLTKFVARNPFESDLTNRLHLSVISPTVFTKVVSPSQGSPVFSWNIDELAVIQPAKIEEFPIQQPHCTDPEIERKAQAAIDRFFQENQIIPSPCDNNDKDNFRKENMQTPVRHFDDSVSSKESQTLKKDSWTQTTLSLPPNLPSHVEEILKPYFTFKQEQNVESDEANCSGNSSLRRKLFAHDDTHEDELESSFNMSSVQLRGMVNCSPLQSGMFNHGTPLRGSSGNLQRNHGTPLAFENMSPLNMSPISEVADEMSCQSIKFRTRSAARLDFTTDMSIEVSVKEVDRTEKIRSSPPDNCWAEIEEPLEVLKSIDEEEKNDTVDMAMHFELPNYLKSDEKENQPVNFNSESLKRPKFANDWCKTFSSETSTYQQNFTLSATNGQQSAFNFAQDTGYQTCSINNTANNTESSAAVSIKEKLHWDEQLLPSEDDLKLSDWKKNMKYMCSSTPSKFLREGIKRNTNI